VRRGLVYMLAGAMRAGDVLATASRGMATDAKQAMPSEPNSAHPTADQARPTPSAQRASRAQKVT
ncbi:MAG TPA: hypothetical protein VF221_22515, partial [Chloroflexota bacterium]